MVPIRYLIVKQQYFLVLKKLFGISHLAVETLRLFSCSIVIDRLLLFSRNRSSFLLSVVIIAQTCFAAACILGSLSWPFSLFKYPDKKILKIILQRKRLVVFIEISEVK